MLGRINLFTFVVRKSIKPKEKLMKKSILLLVALFSASCIYAQTDVTYKINNPSFEVNGAEGWTCTDLVPQTNSSFTKKKGNVYMEKWTAKGGASKGSVEQTVSNLVKGDYLLTVAAQNIQQDNSQAQTGAYIYAKSTTNKTVVTFADNYTVEASITSGSSLKIGFNASSATGNWICCDNFCLTFVSTTKEAVTELIDKAKGQLEKKLNDANIKALNEAIEAAQKAIDDNTEDLTGVANSLMDTYQDALANTKAYTSMKTLINKANLLTSKKMNVKLAEELKNAIDAANAALETTDNDPVALTAALQEAYDKANSSITAYTKLKDAIAKAEPVYDASLNDAEAFAEVISKAKQGYETALLSDEEAAEQVSNLTNSTLLFRIANATPGTGTPVSVSSTNHYVPTGANEALMRADFVGDNVLEKGVCWSTEHNPTVINNRTTKSFSLNGIVIHVKGLEPATVYYLRPYILSKTYEVAYGDEVKIVTHSKGTCRGTWDEGAPTAEANTRCRNAINETIEYFNQWTGINGFTLSGHYGAQTPTADCSYGGWMRIGPNAGNQAIGTVIHETGHGVGVGTSSRWKDTNVHNWKWYGREANAVYSFLENKEANPYSSDFCMVGDGTHGWGSSASYDWFVNGADKDKHQEFQYIGGCVLLYGLFIDGLNPTTAYTNGIPGYTFNFDDNKRYYLMCMDEERGQGTSVLYQRNSTNVGWGKKLVENEPLTDDAAWYIEYNPTDGYYMFKNADSGRYLTHAEAEVKMKSTTKPSATEKFKLMPNRLDIIFGGDQDFKTHGYWFTNATGDNKAMQAEAYNNTNNYGKVTYTSFDYSDKALKQQWIILSEDELSHFGVTPVASAIEDVIQADGSAPCSVSGIYTVGGVRLQQKQQGINIIRYSDGTAKKVYVK